MFTKLLNWLLRRTEEDIYRAKERLIYQYWDGERIIKADPQVLFKRIMEHGPELSIDLKVGRSTLKGAKESHDRALQTIRTAFEIKAPDPSKPLDCSNVLTELEVERTLDDFLSWVDKLKKKLPTTPTPVEAALPNTESSSAASPPTANGLASGSTATAVSTEQPTPSPLEQESLSEPSTPV